jgi:rhomboid family GlyGly-CTERM serine protease
MKFDARIHIKRLMLPISLTVCVTLVMIIGSAASDWLRFDRNAILHGQLWRLLTAHLTHLGWSHLAMNVAGLWLIWLLFGQRLSVVYWLLILFGSALGVSLGLLAFHPDILWYVGLSGVLHGLFTGGCLMDIRSGRKDALLLFGLIVAKLAWEQFSGPLPGSEATAGGKVVVDAHLYGAICGVVLVLPALLRHRATPATK